MLKMPRHEQESHTWAYYEYLSKQCDADMNSTMYYSIAVDTTHSSDVQKLFMNWHNICMIIY